MTKFLYTLLFTTLFLHLQAQQLVSYEYKGSFTLAELQADYGFFMQNGVDMYKVTYTTPDIMGVQDTASGLVVLPVREEKLAYPLLCYQHGTVNSKTDVPSNLQGGYELAVVFGGVGYVTAAADFLGLGEARGFHPYVHADTEASAAIDMLFAVRDELTEELDFQLNDQVFVTGYSQGGHAAMAAHRSLQQDYADDFTVTAAAPMSGPYSISTVFKPFVEAEIEYFFPSYIAYTMLSYDLAYDLFDSIEQYFKTPYSLVIQQFRDGDITLGTCNTVLIAQLENTVGQSIPRAMFQDSVINSIVNDPMHPTNVALDDNNVFEWVPDAPTRLFYCMADDQVPFRNSVVADSVMNANGAIDVLATDVNSAADHGGCVEPATVQTVLFFGQFQELNPVNVGAVVAEDHFSVYPNPTSDVLWLENIAPRSRVQVLDASGKILLDQLSEESVTQLSLNGFAKGLYLVRVIDGKGGARVRRFVKE
ncbi:MAG: T9SS type A sorting domain-containing protein [Bacteroidota bacterium]